MICSLTADGGELDGPTYFGDKDLDQNDDLVMELGGERPPGSDLDHVDDNRPYRHAFQTKLSPRSVLDILESHKYEVQHFTFGNDVAMWTCYQKAQRTRAAPKKEAVVTAPVAVAAVKKGGKSKVASDEEMEVPEPKKNGKAGKAAAATTKASTRAGSKTKQVKDDSDEE